ncbi:MAG: cofactor-independent phosphoglycerate mutase [Phycisphaerae bacterium]|nr:cofactor-independent phosphoglycerate mutase [Phycisphaerae bacterium]
MKYAIIIPDGAADEPLEELGGKTPLEAARTPNMDWIAKHGRIGTVRNIPADMAPGSDVAILSVLGYSPVEFYTGRAPLEAAAQGLTVPPEAWIFRCNLVTIIDGVMEDHSAGHITTEEGGEILRKLQAALGEIGVHFYPGVSYRHLTTIDADFDVQTIPPHDILGRKADDHLPTGRGAERLRKLMAAAETLLAGEEINAVRRELGENPATNIWLWGQGKMPQLPGFEERFGVRGAAITAVDLVRGLSRLIGWDVIDVPGATGLVDTNYEGKAAAAVEALDTHDLVLVHLEGPDEAGHNADGKAKLVGLERIDEKIIAPLLERLQAEGDEWRILVLPDHPTPCRLRTHTSEAVPFAIAGKRMEHVLTGSFTEANARQSDLHIDAGANLMEFFLTVR